MDTTQDELKPEEGDRKKDKKDKVRSAWIAFAGRIIAQLVGAIATVSLGVLMLHRYTDADRQPPAAERPRLTLSEPAAWHQEPPSPPVVVVFVVPVPAAEGPADKAEMARAIATAVSAVFPTSP